MRYTNFWLVLVLVLTVVLLGLYFFTDLLSLEKILVLLGTILAAGFFSVVRALHFQVEALSIALARQNRS